MNDTKRRAALLRISEATGIDIEKSGWQIVELKKNNFVLLYKDIITGLFVSCVASLGDSVNIGTACYISCTPLHSVSIKRVGDNQVSVSHVVDGREYCIILDISEEHMIVNVVKEMQNETK